MKTYHIYRRTFSAKKFPVGSAERMGRNGDARTSEYMPIHKYAIIGCNFSHSTRTLAQAIEFVQHNLKGRAEVRKSIHGMAYEENFC